MCVCVCVCEPPPVHHHHAPPPPRKVGVPWEPRLDVPASPSPPAASTGKYRRWVSDCKRSMGRARTSGRRGGLYFNRRLLLEYHSRSREAAVRARTSARARASTTAQRLGGARTSAMSADSCTARGAFPMLAPRPVDDPVGHDPGRTSRRLSPPGSCALPAA